MEVRYGKHSSKIKDFGDLVCLVILRPTVAIYPLTKYGQTLEESQKEFEEELKEEQYSLGYKGCQFGEYATVAEAFEELQAIAAAYNRGEKIYEVK